MKVSAKIEIVLVLCIGILVAGLFFAGRSPIVLLCCAAALLAALYFVLMILINAPLNSISQALAQEDASYIKGLVGKEDEFGHIAELIDRSFRQKQNLLTEITERKQLDKSLMAKMEELERAYARLQDMQVKLVQSEKLAALGRFASGVVHEVKDPLATLLGGMEYVKSKLPATDPELREALIKMGEAVMRTDIIVKDLLTFARPQKNIVETVHPNILIHDAIVSFDLFRNRADVADIRIQQELTDREIYVEVDKHQVQQAFFSTLLNAVESIPLKGDILVRTYLSSAVVPPDPKDRPVCVIEIADTGVGISDEHMANIFEPFFTTKRDKKGVGLGLSMVRSIIDKNKGAINIQSELNKGTTVRIILPEAGTLRRVSEIG